MEEKEEEESQTKRNNDNNNNNNNKVDDDTHQRPEQQSSSSKYLLWMTKSAVQPRGDSNELELLQQQSKVVQQWANQGGQMAPSILRPARISTIDGSPQEYQSLMTQL